MSTFLFGIGHKAQHGKDTAVQVIHCAHPHETRIYGFSDDLKAHCRLNCGMVAKDGALLQREGDRMRAEDPDVFINSLAVRLVEELPQVALIKDVRYLNEAAWIKSKGGTILKVVRAGFISKDRPANHPSETELDEYVFDHVITVASGDIAGLQRQALDFFLAVWHPALRKDVQRH